jgi:molecular chaperone Hsp33
LLSATLKKSSNQSLVLKFSGSGPIGEIHVQADSRGNIRGYVANPMIDQDGPMDFSMAIGAGLLTIIKDLELGSPYKSVSPILKGDIAGDLVHYLASSEQIPSALVLGHSADPDCNLTASGGVLIQSYPDTPESSIQKIEDNLARQPGLLTEILSSGEDIYNFITEITGGEPFRELDSRHVKAACSCAREDITRMLTGISNSDLKEMIDHDHGAEIICSFCRNSYNFSEIELIEILNTKAAAAND